MNTSVLPVNIYLFEYLKSQTSDADVQAAVDKAK